MRHIKNSQKIQIALLVLSAVSFFLMERATAYVSSSGNYRLQYDSLNSEGLFSSSSSYNLNDTMGEVGSGVSTSSSFNLKAGFQRLSESTIAITSPEDVFLSPDITGVTGGVANGSTSWNVTTDNLAGYSLEIRATTSPAMVSGSHNIIDYTPAGSDPDYDWSVAASDSEFGFTPEGTDIISRFKDDGAGYCATGALNTTLHCWDNLSTSGRNISLSNAYNQPVGTETMVRFRAEAGYQKLQSPGSYAATVIVTAIPN